MYTKEQIKEKLLTNDRWLLIGLITIYKHQTIDERNTRNTSESNGVGFNGPDSTSLTMIAQFLLKNYGEEAIRQDQHATLEKYLDKDWARTAVRNKLPKYANQLAKLANTVSQNG